MSTITNLFEENEVRSIWYNASEEYYFSIVDVIQTLTDFSIPKRYWTDLKRKLIDGVTELYEKLVRLKMKVQDGKCEKLIRWILKVSFK